MVSTEIRLIIFFAAKFVSTLIHAVKYFTNIYSESTMYQIGCQVLGTARVCVLQELTAQRGIHISGKGYCITGSALT